MKKIEKNLRGIKKIEFVEFLDIESNDAWMPINQKNDFGSYYAIGFVTYEDKEKLQLSAGINIRQDGDIDCCCSINIPKKMIKFRGKYER